ncbi:MAG: S41 family peptidase [Planctomycetota bacterium]
MIFFTALLIMPWTAFAQRRVVRIAGPDEPKVNAEQRAEIIERVCQSLNEVYVFPDKAKEMDELLRRKLKDGAYDDITRIGEFADQLTKDLHSICRDLHLAVRPALPQMPDHPADEPADEEQKLRRLEDARYENFGFKKLERLAGNIGYLELRRFQDASIGGETAVAAMNFLAHCDALIIDLRQNGGGSPSMIQLISSYFFEEPVHLNSFYIRKSDSTRQFWTQAQVIGERMVDVPIYVLTSGNTGSAAEEFTYNLKNLERATIIGETTGGGAHPVEFHDFPELNIGMSVPYGRAVNPITGTNWEGTGIEPHISVSAAEALDVARIEAIKMLAKNETDEEKKQQLQWALKTLEASLNPLTLAEEELKAFTGDYGPRKIFMEDGVLVYQREDRPKYQLIPLGDDLFMLKDLEFFRIQFARNKQGKVTELIGLYDNGHRDSNKRTGG